MPADGGRSRTGPGRTDPEGVDGPIAYREGVTPPPSVELTLPADAVASAVRFWRRLALGAFVLGALSLPMALAGLVSDEPRIVAIGIVGALLWGGIGFALRWVAVRSQAVQDGGGAQRVLVGVSPDAVTLQGQVVAASRLAALEIHWFSVEDPRAPTVGAALARGMVHAAHDDAGGNLGLAVVAHVVDDPDRPAVGRAHRLLVEGDLLACAAAVAGLAERYGVPLTGGPTPPPSAPPLPDHLRG